MTIEVIAEEAKANVERGGGIYLRVARKHAADYGDVLWFADWIEHRCVKMSVNYWHDRALRNLSSICRLEIALTVDLEIERRCQVLASEAAKLSFIVSRSPR